MLKVLASKKLIDKDSSTKEFYSYIKDLLRNDEVKKMGLIRHHCGTSCLQHSINVSYYNYLFAKKLRLDRKACAIGGLLHDLYLYDRKTYIRKSGERLHGYRHPAVALTNASQLIHLTDCEKDMILKHMWPLTLLSAPKYKETYIIVLVDKYCCLGEIMAYFAKETKKGIIKSALYMKNKIA